MFIYFHHLSEMTSLRLNRYQASEKYSTTWKAVMQIMLIENLPPMMKRRNHSIKASPSPKK